MPGKARALHPNRKARHAAERAQRPEHLSGRSIGLGVELPRDKVMNALEQLVGVGARFPLHRLGHQRRRRARDRAPVPLKADVRDPIAVELHPQRERVTAQWIVPLDHPIRILDHAVVPRPAVMLENDLLIEAIEVGHGLGTADCGRFLMVSCCSGCRSASWVSVDCPQSAVRSP